VAPDGEFVSVEVTGPALCAFELYRFYHTGVDEIMALRGVDLRVERGEFVALVGPSGSGKSTLLACLAGLDEPDGGHVEVLGQRLTRRPESERSRLRGRHIGILRQNGNLFDHLTVGGNIALQLRLGRRGDSARVPGLLQSLGLEARVNAYPAQLSGGEAARVGLAVALAAMPDVLVCDEPTAEVDAETEQGVLNRLDAVRRSGGAIIIATHSASVARCADRILTIRDGRIDRA
jgi:putative ABC transport system ATP-binding protein